MKHWIRALAELENFVLPVPPSYNDDQNDTSTLVISQEEEYGDHEYPHGSYYGEGDHHHDEHFGVHIEFADLFGAIAFLAAIYAAGLFFSRCLRLPSLIGEIFVGILMGPNLLDILGDMDQAFVLLGEVGLILLVLEAGIDIDLVTLQLIGLKGTLIAVIGSVLPVAIAICVAYVLGYGGTSAIAVGCTFAPTSLGIAMNVLRRAGIVNTPTGQLIVAAAIIDDMIALVVLSQLQSLTSAELSAINIIIPVASAICFLVGGGAIAVFIIPKVLDRYVFKPVKKHTRIDPDWLAMAIMFTFLLALVPTTYYAKASPLMGAFLAGLSFCSNDGAHHMFVSQFKRLMQWLLRIFFAASIGFQVPITKFASGKVILEGLFFLAPLLGKIAVGFLVPNFSNSHRFQYTHLRDCLLVGFSMAAEGEFAFVIAVFGVSNQLISEDLYASAVLAILLSTVVAPLGLQRTLAYYNKRIKYDLFGAESETDVSEFERLRDNKVLFWCIKIKSAPAWGLQTKIVEVLTKLDLDLIDHRAWHPRRSLDTLLNEVYTKDDTITPKPLGGLDDSDQDGENSLDQRMRSIMKELEEAIGQDDAMVEVKRWTPRIEYDEETATRDFSEHIALATSAALDASMRGGGGRPSSDRSLDIKPFDRTPSKDESTAKDDSDLEQEIDPAWRPNSIVRFDSIYSGKLEGMFRHDRKQSRPSNIGYGGYDSDEDGVDHHGRSVEVRARRDPSGRIYSEPVLSMWGAEDNA